MFKEVILKKTKNRGKQTVTAIALILMLSFSFSVTTFLPSANAAHTESDTYAFLTVAPDPWVLVKQ
jgi:hypothetical protein